MRKVELSEEQLATVVAIREAGESWSAIEKKTGIDRRLAKRGFEERNKIAALPTLTSARRDFAQRAFSKHIESLEMMAGSLVKCLRPPGEPKIEISANEKLDGLLNWAGSEEDTPWVRPAEIPDALQRARRRRSNQRLLQALQEHTRLVAPWTRMSQWKSAWDSIRRLLPQFSDEARVSIATYYKRESGAIEYICQQVFQHLWRELLEATVGEESEAVGARIFFEPGEVATVNDSKDATLTFTAIISKAGVSPVAAEKIDKAIRSGRVFIELQEEFNKLVQVYTEFEDILDPAVLGPTIIKTQCKLCPI